MYYERITIPLVRLRLNKENDRHGAIGSEHECIRWMLENLSDEIQNLAKDLAERPLSPIEGILVLPDPETNGDYLVWEGNRRITALKLLDDPNRCPNEILRRKFSEIRNKSKIPVPGKIECVVAPSMEEADRLIELRHQGIQHGVGTLPWNAQQKTRHLARLGKKGRYDFSHQVVDAFSEKLTPALREKVASPQFAISTLDRLLSDPNIRRFLGITNEDGVLRRFLHEKETIKGLTKILSDIADKEDGIKVSDVYSSGKRKEYISRFKAENKPIQTKKLNDSVMLAPGVSAKPKQAPIRSKPVSNKRPYLIPSEIRYRIRDKRLNAIYRELREIELKRHRNAGAVLFRVFMDLSIDLYLEEHRVPVNDNDKLAKRAEKTIKHMKDKGWAKVPEVKGINVAISSPNSVLSFHTFHAYVHNRHFHPEHTDLTTAWDNVQPFLDVLFDHLK